MNAITAQAVFTSYELRYGDVNDGTQAAQMPIDLTDQIVRSNTAAIQTNEKTHRSENHN